MHDTQQVEAILARLMPAALSEGAQSGIEEMIDELSASAAGPQTSRPWWKHWGMGGGIAAAGVAAALLFQGSQRPDQSLVTDSLLEKDPGFVLVGEVNRVESMSDEGWLEDYDGSAMQATRLNVVEENTLRDEETGIVMNISEPREEILLMPISNF